MIDRIYAIVEPGADRIYYSHTLPTEYQKKDGAKIFRLDIYYPDVDIVDKTIHVLPCEEST